MHTYERPDQCYAYTLGQEAPRNAAICKSRCVSCQENAYQNRAKTRDIECLFAMCQLS